MGRKKQPGVPYIKTEKGYPYYYVTVSPGKRRRLHHIVWEQHNGPIALKHMISFRDGNTLNCAIDNLELITRTDIANRNRRPETCYEAIKRFFKTEEGKAVIRQRGEKMRENWQSGRFPAKQRVETLRRRIAAGEIKISPPTVTDKWVSYWLAPRDAQLREFIQTHVPELIAARRAQHNLKKQLKTL